MADDDDAAEVALPLKVLVLGDPAVGKTAYVRRLVRGQGLLGEAGKQSVPADCFKKGYKPSKGVDFALKEFEVDGRTARLQVWDASGEHARRGEVPDVYYQDAFGALLVYDITRPTTFDTVLDWKRDIDERMILPTGEAPPVLLVGAKCDLETASADTAELDRFCADHVRRAASESTQNRHRDHPAPSLMETSRVDAAREPENRGNTRNRRYAGLLRLVRRERQDGLQRGHVRPLLSGEDLG